MAGAGLKIAILGPGGVGGFLAAALADAGARPGAAAGVGVGAGVAAGLGGGKGAQSGAGAQVIVVARESTAEVIAARGLEVRSAALAREFTAHPAVCTRLLNAPDVLLIATKASGLGSALERIGGEPGLVVPLLNGLEHMGALRERFGSGRVATGVIRIESDRPQAGTIVQSSPSVRVDLATEQAALRRPLGALAAMLEAAMLTVRIGDNERQVLWSKLARLNALSLTTSASGRQLGFVRSDPRWRSALEGAVRETVAVANLDGASVGRRDTLAELEQAHPELGSSMQRDIAAGREPELDAIAGAVLRAAARHGILCPTVTWLTQRVALRAQIPSPVDGPPASEGRRFGA